MVGCLSSTSRSAPCYIRHTANGLMRINMIVTAQ